MPIPAEGSRTPTSTVRNTGARAGKEAVILYRMDMHGSVSRPVRQEKWFAKIALEPGAEETVRFTSTPDDLSFIGGMLAQSTSSDGQ